MKKTFKNDKLRVTYGEVKIYKIASYDIETDTSDNMNTFLFGGFINSNGVYKCFTEKDKMIAYMEKHVDKDTYVYATNNSFDHYALFGHRQDFFKEPPLMRGSLLINAKYHGINTFDTRSYTKAGVEAIGVMLGIPKKSLNKFMSNEEYMKKYFNKRLLQDSYKFRKARAYNKIDCMITREFIVGFQKLLNELGGTLKCTIGSCAMDLFKRKYLSQDIQHEYQKKFSDGKPLKELLSEAYHGGRTELFKRTNPNHPHNLSKTYYYYDFNSLYPSVMLEAFPQPSSCHLSYHKRGLLSVNSILNYEGVSAIEGVCPYMTYPILPMVVDHKLKFCVGKIEGAFTHLELRAFLKAGGRIEKIYRTACYTKTFTPFTKWVQELYDLRLRFDNENNTIYKEIIKLLLNNLYGKFFQRNIKNMEFIHINDRNDDDLSQEGFTFDRNMGFGYKETPKESNQTFIIPIIAVYVTAFARMKLYDKLVALQGIYCDTDSILTDVNIPYSKNLGDVKLEYEFDHIDLFLPKTYKLFDKTHKKWVYRTKGIRLGSDKDDDYTKIRTGKPVRQRRFGTIKESIRSQGKFFPNQVRFIEKTNKGVDEKRYWGQEYDSDGLECSKPLIYGMTMIDLEHYFRD